MRRVIFLQSVMQTKIHIVQQSGPLSQNQQPSLKAGSTVNGRVIASLGSNQYSVSLAGKTITVSSSVELKAGQVFTAKLLLQDNTTVLKLLPDSTPSRGTDAQALLKSLGLPVNLQAFNLIQFAISQGLKIDSPKFNKILNRTKDKDGAMNSDKAETALLLEEKGIEYNDAVIESVLTGGEGSAQGSARGSEDNTSQNQSSKDEDDSKEAADINSIETYAGEIVKASENNRAGPLTLFNSIAAKQNNGGHWIVLPFEWDFKNACGVIRVLTDLNRNSLKKMKIDCRICEKNFKFVLYFTAKELKSVKCGFNTISNGTNTSVVIGQELIMHLAQQLGLKTDCVQVVDYDEISAYDAEDSAIPVFEGEA